MKNLDLEGSTGHLETTMAGNIYTTNDTGLELCPGKMAPFTKASGKMTGCMVLAN